jgi:prolyl oligopeptidase
MPYAARARAAAVVVTTMLLGLLNACAPTSRSAAPAPVAADLAIAPATIGTPHHPVPAPALPPPPPLAEVRPVIDAYHGVEVVDPYRYMENLEDPEVLAWLRAQDSHARSVLERLPGVDAVRAELESLRSPVPSPWHVLHIADSYFFRIGNRLYVRVGLTGEPRQLFDGRSLDTAGRSHWISSYAPSPDARHVVIKVIDETTETATLYVLETATSTPFPYAITNALELAAPNMASWRPDSRAFAYLRQRSLAADTAAPGPAVGLPYMLHVVGTDPAEDRAIFGYGLSPNVQLAEEAWPILRFSPVSGYVLAAAFHPLGSSVYVAHVDSLDGARTPWRQIALPDAGAGFWWVQYGDDLYLLTHRDAPRGQVVRKRLLDPGAAAEIVVPQRDGVLQSIAVTSDALFAVLLRDGRHELLRVPHDGRGAHPVPLPYAGTMSTLSMDHAPDPRRSELVVRMSSPTRTDRYLLYDPSANTVEDTGLLTPGPTETAVALEAVHALARSADGALVPLTIVHPVGMARDGSSPTKLYAYATHGQVDQVRLIWAQVPWHRRGGTWATCHARGSGVRGVEWHQAGSGEHLPNRVADVIACAEHLIEHGYTRPGRLAIWGGSAGAVAVGGALTQRPDLFAAAILDVPVLDLLRSELRRLGPVHVAEYGSTATPEGFRTIGAVSPYANVREGTAYPAVLLSTGIHDPRVPPSDAAKMAARLQAATTSGRPALLRIDWAAGHAAFTGWDERISFLLWQLGHPEFQPPDQERMNPDRQNQGGPPCHTQ